MNEDDDLTLFLETTSQYPVSSFADFNGLTPPPEDFEHLFRECQSSHGPPKQYSLSTVPPTPPRTEVVSSPARSSHPSSPESDAAMENDMNFGLASEYLSQDPMNTLSTSSISTGNLPLIVNEHQEINTILDCNDFSNDNFAENNPYFDFASAASSPKPALNPLSFNQQQQPHQFQSSFNNPIFKPKMLHEMPDDFGFDGDFNIDSEETSPTVDVKMEFPATTQPITSFGNPQSHYPFQPPIMPQEFSFTDTFSLMFPDYPRNDPNKFSPRYNLSIEFPKHGGKLPIGFHMPLLKSRVETQIAVKFILTPLQDSITKLRLPRPSISKIKYIEDSYPQNPDTLELLTSLVCSSAMTVPEQLERALCEARGDPIPEWVTKLQNEKLASDENMADAPRTKDESLSDGGQSSKEGGREERKQKTDYSKPLFGAPVQICEQCMNRERKRASRKKNKKPEEEERWAQDEKLRIIVFNTNQVRQLEPVSTSANDPYSLAAESQMRICCYCRHHSEKDGFRVIFTVKDHAGLVVAQTISSSILITDDHKNTAAAASLQSPSIYSDGSIAMPVDQAPQTPSLLASGQPGFMVSQMQPSYSQEYPIGSRANSHTNSPSPSARNSLSPGVHQSKRRKSSKVPANLIMTPSDPSQFHRPQFDHASMAFQQRNPADIQQQWLHSHPITPMAQTPMEQSGDAYFDDPSWGSGDNSFNSPINHIANFDEQQTITAPPKNPSQQPQQEGPLPSVFRVVPSEGPVRGGIEVTILGRGLVNGLTVMFGEIPATNTSYFSDTTLLCRLPPTCNPGTVLVTFKNIESQIHRGASPYFTYVDDVDKELMALALTVVGLKMKGKGDVGTSKQIALRILTENGVGKDFIERNPGGEMSHSDLESTLLTCLDVIDMDESPHPACLGQKNKSGQTMLHLACMLGMQKFVAALLARGVHVNSRDRNGYTPLHFAALYKKPEVVRRLLMNRADPGIRTRGGETAADLGESDQIVRATRSFHQIHSRQHSRSSSVSSEARFSRSRSASSTSLVGTLSAAMTRDSVDDYYASPSDEYSSDDDDCQDNEAPQVWVSRRGSMQDLPTAARKAEQTLMDKPIKESIPPLNAVGGLGSPLSPPAIMSAWMEAWREHLTQSFQNFQQNMPAIPAAVDYQTLFQSHMAKFQNPMPKWNTAKAEASQQREVGAEYKWSELFSPPPPPAYNELYPEGNEFGGQQPEKIMPAEDNPVQTSSSSVLLPLIRSTSPASSTVGLREIHQKIARGDHNLTEAQQAEYRAHIRKMKRIESDRRLYFFWIPVLILIMALMAYNHSPQVWAVVKKVVSFTKQAIEDPLVVRDRLRMALPRALAVP
ncbi:hypothetical protein BDD12DRAFT_815722 [Trichophaea hybrida]|nr:hypothetical protein BDD12DRAFT_815722 [Trichophaea hybrida]